MAQILYYMKIIFFLAYKFAPYHLSARKDELELLNQFFFLISFQAQLPKYKKFFYPHQQSQHLLPNTQRN